MGIRKITTSTLLCSFLVSVNISANTAYTGMRNLTSLQITADMGAGWNLGNAMDAYPIETSWGNPVTTQAMITAVKQKGFKTLRLPVTWKDHLGGAPNYTIDATWLARVEAIANYAFANDMYVIINTHHEDWCEPRYADQAVSSDKLAKVWAQIANRFKNYGDYLIFETLNEPYADNTTETEQRAVVNAYNLAAVNAIRATGGNNSTRFVMVPTLGCSGVDANINALVIPNNDSKIIVSIHYYTPWSFCGDLAGVTTWGTAAEKSLMDSELSAWYNKFVANGRGVVLGEWGTINKNNTPAQVVYADYFVRAAKSRQLAPVVWDDGGNMGNLNRSNNTWRYPTIVDAIINAYGGSCTPTSITPYIQVNGGTWTQTAAVAVNSGATVILGPQPAAGGSWSWSGVASGTSRQVTIYPTSSGTATATYTNTCGATSTQIFTITVSNSTGIVSGGTYELIARHSGKVIGINGGSTIDGALAVQQTYTGAASQQFIVTDLGTGYYRLSPTSSTAKAIDVNGNSTADGASIIQWTYGGGNNQQWQLVSLTGGYYQLKSRLSGKCIDVNGSSTADGAGIIQWACGTGTNQQFSFSRLKSTTIPAAIETVNNATDINIYPNPSNGKLINVELNDLSGQTLIKIVGSNSQLINQQSVFDQQLVQLELNLKPGIYTIQFVNSQKTIVKKFVVQ